MRMHTQFRHELRHFKGSDGMSNENTLNLYLIRQTVNNGFDTFDSAVVAARDEEDARSINPAGIWSGDNNPVLLTPTREEIVDVKDEPYAWTTREHVKVKLIGIASPNVKRGVICASYNAG